MSSAAVVIGALRVNGSNTVFYCLTGMFYVPGLHRLAL